MTDLVLGHDPSGSKIIISRKEQRNSLYVIGKSGSGKSTLLLNMIKQTMDQEIGMCLIDPHSSLINQTIAIATPEQRKRIILIDITDEEYCCGLNLYECPNPQSKKAVNDTVERIMLLWDKLFHITTKEFPQISEYMRQAAHTIVVNPGYTMAEVYKLFRDKEFRSRLLANVQNQSVKEFWEDYDSLPNFERHNQLAAVRRRLSEFLTDMVIPIVGQAKSTIKMSEIMDARPGKILLVKLDRNQESVSSLIGSMLISLIRIAGFARDENKGRHFIVYSDEFSNYASSEYQTIVSELRKYAVCTVMSHQDRYILEQQVPELLRSTLGTNIVVFSLNSIDAEVVKWRFDNTPPEPEIEIEEEPWGQEEVTNFTKDVVGHLLTKGSHESPVVNQFTHEVLAKFNLPNNKGSAGKYLIALNNYLYKAMKGEEVKQEDLIDFISGLCLICNISTFGNVLFISINPDKIDNTEPIQGFHTYWETGDNSFLYTIVYERLAEEILFELPQEFFYLQEQINYANHELQKAASPKGQKNGTRRPISYEGQENGIRIPISEVLSYFHQKYNPATRRHKPTSIDVPQWFTIDVLQLECIEHEEMKHNTVWFSDILYKEWKLLPNQEKKFYKQQDFDNAVNQVFADQVQKFEALIAQLKEVMQALADDPIHQGTGKYRPVIRQIKRKPPQLSSAEMAARTSNMLTTLPNYTAYTRIGGNEYTITVTPPAYAPIDLKREINKIIQQNFRDAYVKKRSEVEKEIAARQQPPAPPAPPTVNPQQTQNKPTATRKTTIGKICPACGVNNAATANFCNACGAKL